MAVKIVNSCVLVGRGCQIFSDPGWANARKFPRRLKAPKAPKKVVDVNGGVYEAYCPGIRPSNASLADPPLKCGPRFAPMVAGTFSRRKDV